MVIGIQIPDGARVELHKEKVYIIFDEKITKRNLWKFFAGIWLTEGFTTKEFFNNNTLSSTNLQITNKNKISFSK